MTGHIQFPSAPPPLACTAGLIWRKERRPVPALTYAFNPTQFKSFQPEFETRNAPKLVEREDSLKIGSTDGVSASSICSPQFLPGPRSRMLIPPLGVPAGLMDALGTGAYCEKDRRLKKRAREMDQVLTDTGVSSLLCSIHTEIRRGAQMQTTSSSSRSCFREHQAFKVLDAVSKVARWSTALASVPPEARVDLCTTYGRATRSIREQEIRLAVQVLESFLGEEALRALRSNLWPAGADSASEPNCSIRIANAAP